MIPGIELSPRCGYVNVIGGFQGLTPLAIDFRRVAAKARVMCLSPNGTEVNSQGCKPLETETDTTMVRNPNGVIVAWNRDQSQARLGDDSRN